MPRAVAEGRKSLEIYPRSSFLRYNYAMYAMYAGDFATAIAEASRLLEENPKFEYRLAAVRAVASSRRVTRRRAQDAYAELAQVSPFGASFAKQGDADLEMYFGRHRDAVRAAAEGIALDEQSKSTAEGVPQKYVALAEAYLALGQRARAADAAREAARLQPPREHALSRRARPRCAPVRKTQALQVAADLEKMLQRQTTAYAGLIRGEIALERGRLVEGIEAFRGADKRHDSWFSRFLLGKAYVEAGHFAEALAELELCMKRRGETTDVFFYDIADAALPAAALLLAGPGAGRRRRRRRSEEAVRAVPRSADRCRPPGPARRRRAATG